MDCELEVPAQRPFPKVGLDMTKWLEVVVELTAANPSRREMDATEDR